MVSMFDPPKEDVKKVLERTKKSGIKTVIMTGDHPLTAESIARQIGIYESPALTGYDLTNIDLAKIIVDYILKELNI